MVMMKLKNYLRSDTLTLVLINFAVIMEMADETLLPGVYKEVDKDLNIDPAGLGSLSLYRSLVQCLCYPLAAFLSARHNRANVIALGAFLWSGVTFLVAISSTFIEVCLLHEIAISRGLNGIGLAIVTPAILSLVADSTDITNHGTAFGWLALTGSFGAIIGGTMSVLIAETSFMGIPGWRISFHLVGIISVLVGLLVYLFAKDPRFLDRDVNANDQPPPKPFQEQIIVAQGVFGSFLGTSLSFSTMWLELVGFSHKTTALITSLFVVSLSCGVVFGGFMGDVLAKHLPNSGRIIVSQISTGSAIPLAAILLLLLPNDPSTALLHGLVLFILGFCASWSGPAANRARTSIYALDRCFETLLASFSPPLVGTLAQQVFGYKPIPEGSSSSGEIETDRQNAASLAKAMYTAIGIPMVICCSIYSFLYFTYPQDRDRVRLQQIDQTLHFPSEERQPYSSMMRTDFFQKINMRLFYIHLFKGLKNYLRSDTLTLVLINVAAIMEMADETLLPGVYKEVGKDLNIDPAGLGSLSLYRSLVQCLCYPLAAFLASRHNRANVIALSAFLWSGLAIVTPAILSLVADSTDDTNRGTAFGWLSLTGGLGSIIGALMSVLIAETSFMGIPGWRISFHLVGIISVLVGLLVRLFAKDPRFLDRDVNAKDLPTPEPFQEQVRELLKEAKAVIKVHSFKIIVAQGVFGSFLGTSLSFTTMWLELVGFSHKTTALISSLFVVSLSCGAVFGGFIGDVLAKHLPNSGRIMLSQISTGSAIPLAAILLLLLPNGPKTALLHGLVLLILGFCASWSGPATNSPIFAEIVPERARTSIYALDRSLETILASFVPMLVGTLAQQVFGYKPIPEGSSTSGEIETDRQNAASLAKAMYTAIGIPMVICCSIYSLLYFTYP
ncbi:hypothetical protein H5410_028878 [Solanum commersonii]|uniref:Major facilitator superfamily (MFS) profile domain-containing protein n=1 Tax=Solanum commersonii TaxID=4109 RepID=A0A9J5Z3X6_SOLCO|nr:hypothetical protein H5410_028878 [Solanum commersonii]